MATMQVEVVSAERRLLSVEAEAVYARSLEGEIGILPGHQPCLLALDIAPVKVVKSDGTEQRIAVHNGFLFYRGDTLVILADTAELPEDIDTGRAEKRKQGLEEEQRSDEEEVAVRSAIKRQELRLDLGSRG